MLSESSARGVIPGFPPTEFGLPPISTLESGGIGLSESNSTLPWYDDSQDLWPGPPMDVSSDEYDDLISFPIPETTSTNMKENVGMSFGAPMKPELLRQEARSPISGQSMTGRSNTISCSPDYDSETEVEVDFDCEFECSEELDIDWPSIVEDDAWFRAREEMK